MFVRFVSFLLAAAGLVACDGSPPNNPYPPKTGSENVLYSAFTGRPKHLDPARSYSEDEAIITAHVYEPLLEYDYLARPFQLKPLTAATLPTVVYFDRDDKPVDEHSPDVSKTVYQIKIKPGIRYQNHPALARCGDAYCYLDMPQSVAMSKFSLQDFTKTGTRELTAADFAYAIKRLADPTVNSPIYGIMENYIVGLEALNAELKQVQSDTHQTYFDLRNFDLTGVKVVDEHTIEVTVAGKYPQFLYWLTMPFFAPMPWEACQFYSQKGLIQNNVVLDWYPIGTGPFMLTENNPNWRMVLSQNPNFRAEYYPETGPAEAKAKELLQKKGQRLPFVDKVVFHLEKEAIPYWNKFLQGYYDQAAVSSHNFDQAIQFGNGNQIELTAELKEKGIKLNKILKPSIFYWGFNMLDDTVGGNSPQKQKLRQAISIAIDVEEYINIFLNGNGIPALSPLPPDFWGQRLNTQQKNPIIYKSGKRRSIQQAKKLLKEAGYPWGIDPKTKRPLQISYDAVISGGSGAKEEFAWLRKQFQKLGIELIVRATQYNRFQDKMRNGDFQFYRWGWNADYPDPENFLFLLYSQNSKTLYKGENASNYHNPQFDRLFEQIKDRLHSEERERLIGEMINLLQQDAPWVWGIHPQDFVLRQPWVEPYQSHPMARNTLKYMSLDTSMREQKRLSWNQPIYWPIAFVMLGFIGVCLPAAFSYHRQMYRANPLKQAEKLKNE